MVHRREVDGRPLVLGNQGDLWGNAMTWFDHETGSVWSQPIGEAILGPLTGTRLDLLASTLTEWGDWLERHPDTVALDAPARMSGFALAQMAIVVEFGSESVAFPVSELRQAGVVNTDVGGVAVAVTVDDDSDDWAVYSRLIDGRTVELERSGDDLVAADGSGRWSAERGVQRSGDGGNLDVLPGFTSFPADYTTFFPDGAFWRSSGLQPVAGS